MNIQQLRYVVATADTGSMTAAAASLYVAQPALSRAVRSLERELAATIFIRSGRGVALTLEGERFVVRARSVLRSLEALRDLGSRVPAAETLVIAASPTLQASLALPILASLRQQGIEVPTRLLGCGGSREVHALVASGRADLGLCDQVVESDLAVVALGLAEVQLVSPAGLDLPARITVNQLHGLPLVLPTVGTDRRAALDWFFDACEIVPTVAIESDERSVWMEAVLRGLASCLWHSVEALSVPAESYELRGFEPAMHSELSAVHRPGRNDPVMVLILEVVRRFAELRVR